MLIEFSVANFRSFRERTTLSMVAAPRLHKKENTFQPSVDGEKLPPLLKVAAIYGPNASGKSNLVRAMEVITKILRRKPSTESSSLPVSPFRFDPALAGKPSEFEVHFVHTGTRYEFELKLSADRICGESLTAYYGGKETLLYRRTYDGDRDEYEFGGALEGGRELHEVWRRLTAPKILFIAQAVANSNEELLQLRRPFQWLANRSMVVADNIGTLARVTQRLIVDVPEFSTQVAKLLSDVDIPITGIKVTVEPGGSIATDPLDEGQEYSPKEKHLMALARANVKTVLTHTTTLGSADFDFEEESEGTQNIFGFTIPWLLLSQTTPEDPHHLLIVDELDSSLHPSVVAALVERHINSHMLCQLIFTTHDTHLMDTKLLRRDQIWTTERDGTGATSLRSIHDFEGRESEDIEKRYFEGRYRALPLMRRS